MMRVFSLPVAATMLACLSGGSSYALPAQVERVALGSQNLIQLESRPTRVALGDPSIVDLKLLSGNQLRLVGLKAGTTNVTVWTRTRTLPSEHAYTVVVGPEVAVINSELAADSELNSAKAVSTPRVVTLQGEVPGLDARARAETIARNQAGKDVGDALAVADRRMVAIEVRFAAVSTNTMKALGLNFQKLGGGMQFATGVPGSVSSFQLAPELNVQSSLPLSQAFSLLMNWPGSDFSTAISALSSVNLAQLLAEPTLMVRSGEQADFLAGGEIPIPVTQSGQTTGAISIEYRKFGVQLHVRATVLSEDRIVLKVNPEVSELDYENALTLQGFNVPAIRVRSTDTNIELGNGQSFVLAGLMFSSRSNIEEKVPGLGSLPIVGDFFKRSQNSAEQQELIIVATPRLVSPMAAASVPKLPGEGLAYAPGLDNTLLNTNQLDDFVAQYGLSP
jgi:pilus assembly protein CpaC